LAPPEFPASPFPGPPRQIELFPPHTLQISMRPNIYDDFVSVQFPFAFVLFRKNRTEFSCGRSFFLPFQTPGFLFFFFFSFSSTVAFEPKPTLAQTLTCPSSYCFYNFSLTSMGNLQWKAHAVYYAGQPLPFSMPFVLFRMAPPTSTPTQSPPLSANF